MSYLSTTLSTHKCTMWFQKHVQPVRAELSFYVTLVGLFKKQKDVVLV